MCFLSRLRKESDTDTISVRDLHKSFNGVPVLRGVNLEIPEGELTVLIGPSGCGKSTLLRCLNGLEVADQGTITINGFTLDRSRAGDRRTLVAEARQLRSPARERSRVNPL